MRWNISDNLFVRSSATDHLEDDLTDFRDLFWAEKIRPYYIEYSEIHQCCRLFRRDVSDNSWLFLKGQAAKQHDLTPARLETLPAAEQTALAEIIVPRTFTELSVRDIFVTTVHSSIINPFLAFTEKIKIIPIKNLYNVLYGELADFSLKKYSNRFDAALAQGIRSITMSYFLYALNRGRLLFPLKNNSYYKRYMYRDYIALSFFPHREFYENIKSLESNTVSRFMRLLLCSSIKTADDFRQSDFDLLVKQLSEESSKKNRKIITTKLSAIKSIVMLLIHNGRKDLEYRDISRRTKGLGKTDGTFYYLSKDNLGHDKLDQWREAFKEFTGYKLDRDEITDPQSISRGLNIFAEFLLQCLSDNLHFPSSPKKVSDKFIKNWKLSMKERMSKDVRAKSVGIMREFFSWAQLVAKIWPYEKPLPLTKFDQPRRARRDKSVRGVMPISHRDWLLNILDSRPPEDYEYVLENSIKVKKQSPTKKNLIKVLLTYPLRKSQVAWLDTNKCIYVSELGNGLYVNTNKTGAPYVIPYLPKETEVALREQIEWEEKYNVPLGKPVVYMRKKNPRFESIYPLFRLIGSTYPISSGTIDDYWARLVKQLEDEINEYLSTLNKAKINLFTSDGTPVYDIHTLRVTGITNFIEAGVSPDVVMLIAGHSSLVMTFYYTKRSYSSIREMLREATEQLRMDREMLHKALSDDIDKAFEMFSLSGNKESLKGVHPTYWMDTDYGICPGMPCPQGKERRCGMCPYLITGPIFLLGLTTRTNMILEHLKMKLRGVKHHPNMKMQNSAVWREAAQDSQEFIALVKLISDISAKMDEQPTSGDPKLYARVPAKISLKEMPEYEFLFHRCLEIEALPESDENDTIDKAWHLREKLFHSLGCEDQLRVYVPDDRRLKVLTELWEYLLKRYPSISERNHLFSKEPTKLIGVDNLASILEVIDNAEEGK